MFVENLLCGMHPGGCFIVLLFVPIFPPNQIFGKGMYAGRWMSGHCAERHFPILTEPPPPKAIVSLQLIDQELCDLSLLFTLFPIYIIWQLQDIYNFANVLSAIMVLSFLAFLDSQIG